jgi:hypothetical protein
MSKRISIKLLSGFLAATLLSVTFISFCICDPITTASNKTTLFIKASAAGTTSAAVEPFEEKETKDTSEEIQSIGIIPFSDEAAFARLLSKSTLADSQSISSFGNTTFLPIYLAKRSFLI